MLVTASWLLEHLEDPDVVVVDLRWDEQGSGREHYEEGHVPGARFLDWATDLVDPGHHVAFMLATPERLAEVLGGAGVGDETVVLAYADAGHSGPFRLWWACSLYGHDDQVRILDGGLEAWLAEGGRLSREVPRTHSAVWTPRRQAGLLATAADVVAAQHDPKTIVLDSRPREQFLGEAVWFESGAVHADADGVAHTPRGDLRAGHVPWAASVPWQELYRPDLSMKEPAELGALFGRVGATPHHRAIAYCGVGISASALLYALKRAGVERAALYDAGWDEWGRDPSLPVARGL